MSALVPNKTNDYTLGRGALYFAPFKPGTQLPEGERFIGDANSIEFTFKSTDLDHYSSVSGIKEMDDSITLQVDRSGQFVTENIDPDNLALFFLGASSVLSQSTATVTAEVVSGVEQGLTYQLGATTTDPVGHRGLDTGTAAVVTNTGATVTYAAGTDYVVDYVLGRLLIVEGGTIAPSAPQDIKATYHVLAGTRDRTVSGGTAIEGQLRFVSFNPIGTQKDALAPWVRISPNGNFALIGDKFTALTFDVKVLKKTAYGLEALYIDGRVA
jgi:hypothetical protein